MFKKLFGAGENYKHAGFCLQSLSLDKDDLGQHLENFALENDNDMDYNYANKFLHWSAKSYEDKSRKSFCLGTAGDLSVLIENYSQPSLYMKYLQTILKIMIFFWKWGYVLW